MALKQVYITAPSNSGPIHCFFLCQVELHYCFEYNRNKAAGTADFESVCV